MGKVIEVNGLTGEVVEREQTPEEISFSKAEYDKQRAAEESEKVIKKSAIDKLTAIGLTAEEIAILGVK